MVLNKANPRTGLSARPVGCLLLREAGIYLFSQAVSSQLSSAQVSLTSVFGMGTGGPSPQSTPTIYMLTAELKTLAQSTQHKMCGDPYRIRTDVNGVRGHCLNHLTNGPRTLYKSARALYTWSAFGDSNPGPTD